MSRGTVWSKMKLVRAASWWAKTTSVVRRLRRAELADDVPRRALGEAAAQPAGRAALEVLRLTRGGDGAASAPAARLPRRTATPASAATAAGTPIGA